MLTAPFKTKTLCLLIAFTLSFAICGYSQQKLVPIRFNVTVSVYSLPYLVAYEAGIFKKNGIDLRPSITPELAARVARSGIEIPRSAIGEGGGEATNASFTGDMTGARIPLTIGGLCPVVWGASTSPTARGKDTTVAIASHYDHTHWKIIARKDITTPEQLKGKRIGYSRVGTIAHFMDLVFAKKMGWDPVQDVSLISDSIDLDNIRKGLVDAVMTSETVAIQGKSEGFNQVVDMQDARWRVPMASNSLHVDRAWLKNNRDTAVNYVKSMLEGIALMQKDKEATYKAMAKWFAWTDPKEQAELYIHVLEFPRKPYPAVDGIKEAMKVYDSLEMRKFKPTDFYDDSIIRDLDKSGFIDGLYK